MGNKSNPFAHPILLQYVLSVNKLLISLTRTV